MNDQDIEEAYDSMFGPGDPYRDSGPRTLEERQQAERELREGKAGPPTSTELDEAMYDIVHGRPRSRSSLRERVETRSGDLKEQTRRVLEDVSIDGNILQGVAVLGAVSRNGRRYSRSALQDVVNLVREDRTKVFLDHRQGKGRSVRDLVGHLSRPRLVEDRVRANLKLLATEHASLVRSLAEDGVQDVGLSIDARGDIRVGKDGDTVVETVAELRSVDVVVSPATVSSLSEATGSGPISDAEVEEAYERMFG